MSNSFLFALDSPLVSVRRRWKIVLAVLIAAAGLAGCGGPEEIHVYGSQPPDAVAPSAPTGVIATASSSSQINLTWTAATDNVGVTEYRIERCQTAGCANFAQIATTTATSFNNTGLVASTSYSYRVRAADATPNLGPYSNVASATTQAPDTQAPTAPGNLTATASQTLNQVNLTWTAAVDAVGVTEYRVERCVAATCVFAQIATTLGTALAYTDATGLSAATSYSYRVRAGDAASNLGPYSNVASATTPAPDLVAPTAPSNLAAVPFSGSRIDLGWTASFDAVGVTEYRIERCQAAGCSQFSQVGTTSGAVTSFSDVGLTPNTTYSYRVRASDAAVNLSQYSGITGATTPAPSGVISVSAVPSRTSGVAPLAVFFDATGTTSPLANLPFHEIEYRWNFGDPAGGATWSMGSRAGVSSKNVATGPMAAHVFETPGTYFVTLSAFDGTNTDTATVRIDVGDPNVVFAGTNTVCFSNTNDFTGCPQNARTVPNTTDFGAALANNAAPNRRLLFRGGETFSVNATTEARLAANGPGIIGSYGSGKARLVSTVNGTTILAVGSRNIPNLADWRIMDLNIDGQTRLGNRSTAIWANEGGFDQLTFLRLDIHDVGSGYTFYAGSIEDYNTALNTPHHLWDQLAIVDNTIRRIGGGNAGNPGLGVFLAGRRMSFLGNEIDDTTEGEHPARVMYANRFVFSNNTVSRAPGPNGPRGDKETLTIRAINSSPGVGRFPFVFTDSETATEKVLVSDNQFVITGYVGAAANDVNNIIEQRLLDFVFERNWYRVGTGATTTGGAMDIRAIRVTIRNEIIDATGFGGSHYGINLMSAIPNSGGCPSTGCMLAASNVRVLNNSFYSADAGGFEAVRLGSGVTNITVQNNLAYAPRASGVSMIVNLSGLTPTTCATCNSSVAQITGTSPGWTITTPMAPSGFRPAGSYAVGGGIPTTAFSDFNLNARTVPYDMGAVNR